MSTVMYIREQKQSVAAMKGVLSYCCRDDKVNDNDGNRYVSGVNCDGENSFTEFMTTKNAFGKTDGMNFYQYVQSFSPEENISPHRAHEIAISFANEAWQGHEILVATHCDAGHLHSHFVINSVSFETGKKLRQHPDTLKKPDQLGQAAHQGGRMAQGKYDTVFPLGRLQGHYRGGEIT